LGGDATNEIKPEDAFVKNSKLSRSAFKNKVLKYKLIEYKCKKCGLANEWNKKKLTLHLDHINGDSSDNRIENLRFLCPNCHSQTKTYCVNSIRKNVNYCSVCENPLSKSTKGNLCKRCLLNSYRKERERKRAEGVEKKKNDDWRRKDRIHKRKFNVSKDELQTLLDNKSFCEIGRIYNVSDNAIKKRAIRMGLIDA